MAIFDEMLIKIQEGDLISSKKGFLAQSPLTKEWYIYKKAKYLSKGNIEVIGEKEPVDVKINEGEAKFLPRLKS